MRGLAVARLQDRLALQCLEDLCSLRIYEGVSIIYDLDLHLYAQPRNLHNLNIWPASRLSYDQSQLLAAFLFNFSAFSRRHDGGV